MNGKVSDILRRKRLIVPTSADYVTQKNHDNQTQHEEHETKVTSNNTSTSSTTLSDYDEESSVEYRVKSGGRKTILKSKEQSILEDEWLNPDDDLAATFDDFGTTPPRTRLKIKNRDWERKQKSVDPVPKKGMSRLARSRVCRRNTMDCALLNEIFIDEETKRNDKRAQALLRDAEREMKNSLTNQHPRVASFHEMNPESVDSFVNPCSRNCEVPTFIESCNRYMSVSSRPIGCRSSAPPLAFAMNLGAKQTKETPALHSRKEFHETFANLIKLGSTDRQEIKPTQEEHTWQTELKDLIWLELQAWQADRTMEQQDRYLFASRQGVPDLLNEIINYK